MQLMRASPLILRRVIAGIGRSSSATMGAKIVSNLAMKLHMPVEVILL